MEDEEDLAVTVRDWLAEENHQVDILSDGRQALAVLQSKKFDVLIVDWMLPSLSGIELCSAYRSRGGAGGVIMLTAKRALDEKEQAFEQGADDYLTKPFQLRELSARIKAMLRRLKPEAEQLDYGDLLLRPKEHKVLRAGQEIHLLPKEFSILQLIMRQPGKVFSLEEIVEAVWGMDADVTPETVRSNIKSMRRKLDWSGKTSYITNVHGVGYKLELPRP